MVTLYPLSVAFSLPILSQELSENNIVVQFRNQRDLNIWDNLAFTKIEEQLHQQIEEQSTTGSDLPVSMTSSRCLADRKVEKFENNPHNCLSSSALIV